MLIEELYINRENISTVTPYMMNGEYGLQINGTRFQFGEYDNIFGENEEKTKEIITTIKKYRDLIVNEVEKVNNGRHKQKEN